MKQFRHPAPFVILTALLVWSSWRILHLAGARHHPSGPAAATSMSSNSGSAEAPASSSTESLPLEVHFTREEWNGKPVFQLLNKSPMTLHNIMLYSYSGNFMVPLSIGDTAPKHISNAIPLNDPPYDLSPQASEWFVAPEGPPLELYVTWTDQSQMQYEYVLSTE